MSIKSFKGQRLFKGLSKDFLAQLEAIAVLESKEKGAILIRTVDPAKNFYLLEEGRICIRAERNKNSVSFLHTPGDFFGWSCLLDSAGLFRLGRVRASEQGCQDRKKEAGCPSQKGLPERFDFYKKLC